MSRSLGSWPDIIASADSIFLFAAHPRVDILELTLVQLNYMCVDVFDRPNVGGWIVEKSHENQFPMAAVSCAIDVDSLASSGSVRVTLDVFNRDQSKKQGATAQPAKATKNPYAGKPFAKSLAELDRLIAVADGSAAPIAMASTAGESSSKQPGSAPKEKKEKKAKEPKAPKAPKAAPAAAADPNQPEITKLVSANSERLRCAL